ERYEAIRPGLGIAFRAEVTATLDRVEENPKLYAAESGSLRIAPLRRFPYAVVYEELSERIWVAAVSHYRRRPGYWSGRRPD
ncbi:MAG: type II toxin-antitoxin system RelE/ParE family toxin, partial [Fimbriiglobus sp.]